MDRLRCGILGSTGMIGQRFVQFLSGHPWFELTELYTSRRVTGRTYSEVVGWMLGPDVPDDASEISMSSSDPDVVSSSDADILFSALPADAASRVERAASKAGKHVISNSSLHRMDLDVPLVVPEVNGGHLSILKDRSSGGVLATNPNCTTTGLVMALGPMKEAIGGEVFVSSYQAISGAGHPGVPALDIFGNVLPFIDGEEEKLVQETGKILGKVSDGAVLPEAVRVVPNCVRVGVRDGHLISVSFRLNEGYEREDVFSLMDSLKGLQGLPSAPAVPLVIRTEEDRPRPDLDAFAGDPPGMSATVGRVRVDEGILRMFVLVNNTIRGGAGNAVLIAEMLKAEGFL